MSEGQNFLWQWKGLAKGTPSMKVIPPLYDAKDVSKVIQIIDESETLKDYDNVIKQHTR
jgi:hypothetical protein